MVEQLRGIALFEGVNDEDLRALASRAKRRALPAGRLVFREGEPASALYIVLAGAVKIFLTDLTGAEVVLDTKKAGEYFGEMMLDHRPRSASVMTLEPCEFAVISREDFRRFIRDHADAAEKVILNLIHIARSMNDRARDDASVVVRLRHYVSWLQEMKATDLPEVARWAYAKRWALGGLFAFAVAQYYFMDVLRQVVSTGGLTTFR